MRKSMKRLLFISFALIIVVSGIIVYGVQQEEIKHDTGKIYVTVTTTFLGDVVEQIGGDNVVVTRLMGAGVDPHQYQASSSDLEKLTSADLVFYAGLHLEAKLGDVLEKLAESGKPITNTSKYIPKEDLLYGETLTEEEIENLTEEEGIYDPHIWFDVNLWKIVVDTVKETLEEYDKENTDFYEVNYQQYLQELDGLEDYIREKILELPEALRYLITAHDAFNYFSRYTGIEVHGIQGINTTVEAGTNDVSETAGLIVEHQIKAIFIESSVSPKLIQALQEAVKARGHTTEIGGELYSDSTGTLGTPDGTYIGMYKHNIDTIINALK